MMKDVLEKIDNFQVYKDIKSYLLWGNYENISCPLVSIIMPVYNHPDYLKVALESAVNQDYDGCYEIIVVDNNDMNITPTTNQKVVEEINSSKILYYRNDKNLGMFGNFNRGIELARAPFVTFLHDDDVLMPEALSVLMYYSTMVDTECIIGRRLFIDSNGEEIPQSHKKSFKLLEEKMFYKKTLFDKIYEGSTTPAGEAALWKKNSLQELGGFNLDYYPSADFALETAYLYFYGIYTINLPVLKYRLAENESYNAYAKWYEKDKWILSCLIGRMKGPKFLFYRIMNAKLNIQKILNEIKWGGKDLSLKKEIRLSDRIICKLFSMIYPFLSIGRRFAFTGIKK